MAGYRALHVERSVRKCSTSLVATVCSRPAAKSRLLNTRNGTRNSGTIANTTHDRDRVDPANVITAMINSTP